MSHPNSLNQTTPALIIVDVQEAFREAIGNFAVIAESIARAARGFAVLDLPVLVTEQYPQGLGPTVEEIRFSLPEGWEPFEKTTFSAFRAEKLRTKLADLKATHIVLAGIETHVCVQQTALDLLISGYTVHLLTDCVGSRFEHDKAAGLVKMKASGVVSSSVEMALFEIMADSRHPKFREIQDLIK